MNINFSSSTPVYIQEIAGDLYYRLGSDPTYNLVSSTPVTLQVTDAGLGHVYLETDITIGNVNDYFIGTSGSGTFVFDGQEHTVTLNGVANYGGLFSELAAGQTVQNVHFVGAGGATLDNNAGAIVGQLAGGQVRYCSSDIDIPDGAGGIVGAYSTGTINGCYSTGTVTGDNAGGIIGMGAGNYGGGLTVSDCYSTGDILGMHAGGIIGAYAAEWTGQVLIEDCFTVGDINGALAGGVVGAYAGNYSGQINISDSYTTGAINGQSAGGVAGASPGASFGNVTMTNVFSTGAISGYDTGGVAGGYSSSPGEVLVQHAYTSGAGDLSFPNGIFTYSDANGQDNPSTPPYIGLNNYSEANNGNSGVWDDANATATLLNVGSGVWVSSYAPNTPYTLAAFSPTLAPTTDLTGASLGTVYDLSFEGLVVASGASSRFNTIESFEVTPNTSSGAFYSGSSFATATRFYSTETLDASDHVYWIPSQSGAVAFGSAMAVGYSDILDQYFNSAISTEIAFSIAAPATTSNSNAINMGGYLLTQQTMSNNATIVSNNASLTTQGNLQCMGGTTQSGALSGQNTANVATSAVTTLPSLMAVKTQKIMGLLGAVTAEMAESMMSGVSASNTDGTRIAGSSMIAPLEEAAHASAAPLADIPMQAMGYPVYGYNYFYLSDFQGSSNFRVTSQSNNPLTTNFLELINNTGGSQNIDISGYQGIVVATPGVNVTGLTTNNSLGSFGGGSYTFGAGDQTLFLMGPNSNIVGGGGIDTVRFLGVGKGGVSVSQTGGSVSIWSDWLETGSGVTYLYNVARAQFDDGSIAFDTGAGQNAGSVYRLYEAAFNREGDQEGLGYWISQIDQGSSLKAVANQFLTSQEFINLYGNSPSVGAYVTALYNNVLGRAPDAPGASYWEGRLLGGESRAQLLIEFAESVESVGNTAGHIAQGVHYQQWVQ